ncbi:hypothetical protein [Hyphomonas sp. KY3]|uniref:hypothetical protein n=1 Tax=Hyphomonas sp. KY3 TaxID=2016196 RepID=UPI001A8FEAAA|nr:hypothetical protein [Hyphomonas sp. KY3]QSR22114.1 hypothetical protein CFA77_07375 [Hyphomonas sp. KY3]
MAAKMWKASKSRNPAEVYNEKRRIIFAQIQKDPAVAKTWLEGYRDTLGPAGYAGLKAEVAFFEQYHKDLNLVVAADIGDATDFVGVVDGAMHRIDVTTNVAFKRLASYEPLQLKGALYKVAVFDQGRFDLVDINFPFCEHCKSGRILPTAVLLEENHNRHGDSQWSNDQLLVNICSACGEVEVADRITTPFLYDFQSLYRDLNEAKHEAEDFGETPIDVRAEAGAYARRASRYLSDFFGTRLVAIGGKSYEITNPRDGDGYWAVRFEDQLPLVQEHLQDNYPWDLTHG